MSEPLLKKHPRSQTLVKEAEGRTVPGLPSLVALIGVSPSDQGSDGLTRPHMEFKTKVNGQMIKWVTTKKERFSKPCPGKN